MNQTSFLYVAIVTWISIRSHTSAERGESLDHKTASRTAPIELYISLH
jgi:hypothetical protein